MNQLNCMSNEIANLSLKISTVGGVNSIINDLSNSSNQTWSSSKIQSVISSIPSSPSSPTSFSVYVNKGGNDSTANGTIESPYKTITAAMASITYATISQRVLIILGPGDYNDNFAIKANVAIAGYNRIVTRLTGTVTINDSSWNNNNDNRSSFFNLAFTVSETFDFTSASAFQGKLYFYECRFNNTVTFNTTSGPFNQIDIENSLFFNSLTIVGGTAVINSCTFLAGTITIASNPLSGNTTSVNISGGGTSGNVALVWTSPANGASLTIESFKIAGNLTANGAQATLSAGCDSIPSSGVGISNSAIFTNLTPNISLVGGVNITSPTSNQVLQYNGSNWVNQALTSAPVSSVFSRTGAVVASSGDYSITQITNSSTLANSSNINLSSPSTGQALTYNGSQWVNSSILGYTNLIWDNTDPTISAALNTYYVIPNICTLTPPSNPPNGTKLAVRNQTNAITIPFSTNVYSNQAIYTGGVTVTSQSNFAYIEFEYVNTSGVIEWIVTDINGIWNFGSTKTSPVNDIGSISNVSISSPATNQTILYNGTNWANGPITNVQTTTTGGGFLSSKIWAGTATTNSSGVFTVALAGFTTITSITATAALSGSTAATAPIATLTTYNTTAVNGLVVQSNVVSALGGNGLTNAGTGIVVNIIVFGT